MQRQKSDNYKQQPDNYKRQPDNYKQQPLNNKKTRPKESQAHIKRNLAYLKKNNRFAKQQDENYLKHQEFPVGDIKHQVRIKNTTQLLIFGLYCSAFLLPPVTKASPTNSQANQQCGAYVPEDKLIVLDGVNREDCFHINDEIGQLQQYLPETASMIKQIQSQEDFSYVCKAESTFKSGDMGNTRAVFYPALNIIAYPAKKKNNPDVMHHELLHAFFRKNHNTIYCNPNLLTKDQQDDLKKQNIWRQDFQDSSMLTPSPIWPPSSDNLQYMMKEILESDKNKITELTQLHIKVFNNEKLSPTEQTAYQKAIKVFKKNIPEDVTYNFNTDSRLGKIVINQIAAQSPNGQINLDAQNSFPNAVIDDEGIIYKNLKFIKAATPYFEVTIENGISTFLHRYRVAWNNYHQYESNGEKLNAFKEIIPYMLQGAPRAAVRNYLPALFNHLENDEACCVKGETSRCYPYEHQQPATSPTPTLQQLQQMLQELQRMQEELQQMQKKTQQKMQQMQQKLMPPQQQQQILKEIEQEMQEIKIKMQEMQQMQQKLQLQNGQYQQQLQQEQHQEGSNVRRSP